jgi:hypothetical protein
MKLEQKTFKNFISKISLLMCKYCDIITSILSNNWILIIKENPAKWMLSSPNF